MTKPWFVWLVCMICRDIAYKPYKPSQVCMGELIQTESWTFSIGIWKNIINNHEVKNNNAYAKDANAPSGASNAAPVIGLWGSVQHRIKMAPISTPNGTNLDHAGGKGYTKINTNMKQKTKRTPKWKNICLFLCAGFVQKSVGATVGRLPMFYSRKW